MVRKVISRRSAVKYAGLIAVAGTALARRSGYGATRLVHGYGTDPNLLKRTVTWPKTLDTTQLSSLACICDIVLPTDPPYRSAAAIGVHEFIDEWVSAPYPQMQADRVVIVDGLHELDTAAMSLLGHSFAKATAERRLALFDKACAGQSSIGFARRVIELICDGYYTTREGHAAIGYVGNTALPAFPEPPPEVLRHLEEMLALVPDSERPALNKSSAAK
jgi:hypothetical protein